MTALTRQIEIEARWTAAAARQGLVTRPRAEAQQELLDAWKAPPRVPRDRSLGCGFIALCAVLSPLLAIGIAVRWCERQAPRAWAALKRAPDACDCLGQIIEVAARTGSTWLLAHARAGTSWVARQSGAVRQRAARARRKRLVRARRTCRDLFDPERLTETARLRIAAAAWDAQQERFERSTEITLTLAGAGLWAATIATSRVWS